MPGSRTTQHARSGSTALRVVGPRRDAAGASVNQEKLRFGETARGATPRTRIVVAAPERLARAGLRALLEKQPDLVVVAETDECVDAVRLGRQLRADVLLVDAQLLAPRRLDALRTATETEPPLRVLVLAGATDRDLVVEALQAGACGAAPRESTPELLYRAVRCSRTGEAWVSRETVSLFLRTIQHNGHNGGPRPVSKFQSLLTPRELAIVREVTEGATNREVAAKLTLSEQTVKNHLNHIFDKLGVSSRLELAVHALHHGLEPEHG